MSRQSRSESFYFLLLDEGMFGAPPILLELVTNIVAILRQNKIIKWKKALKVSLEYPSLSLRGTAPSEPSLDEVSKDSPMPLELFSSNPFRSDEAIFGDASHSIFKTDNPRLATIATGIETCSPFLHTEET